jgi:uridine kinase
VLGVAGGTGSGKTTVADRLAEIMGAEHLALLKLDSYYRNEPHLPFEERALVNYDHPDAFDFPLLHDHVSALCRGEAVQTPLYDFTNYLRAERCLLVRPARIIVVEGILVLYEADLRELFDLKIFVDTDADVRFIRRLQRDVTDRGRTVESVIEQYLATVRPSHMTFIEPTKRYADIIVPHGGMNAPAVDVILARMRELLG